MTQTLGLAFVMLGAADVERAVSFYGDTLGLKPAGRFEDFAFFEAGGISLAISGELGQRGAAGSDTCEFVFGVPSVEQSYRELQERGVAFVNEPHPVNQENWVVNFRDPDGHLLSLYGKR